MRQTLEREVLESINLDIKEDSALRRLIEAIDDLFERMYDRKDSVEEIFMEGLKNEGLVPMAYSTLEDDETIEVKAMFDLNNLMMVTSIQGTNSLVHQETKLFNDVDEVIEDFQWCDFECLTSYSADADWLIKTLHD